MRRLPSFYWLLLVVLLASFVPVVVLLAVSYYQAIQSSQEQLAAEIDQSVRRTNDLLTTADTLLTRIAADTGGQSSPEAFNLIRRYAYNDPRFREVGIIDERGFLVLSSLGVVNPPILVPAALRANPSRRVTQVLGPVKTVLMKENSLILSLPTHGEGEVNLLVDPAVLTHFLDDSELGPNGFIAFVGQDSHLMGGVGLLPDERLDITSAQTSIDRSKIQVVRSTRKHDITIVGQIPLRWVLRYWWHDLTIGILFSLLCSGFLMALLIRSARRTYGIGHDIRIGLTHHEFVVYYQPIIDLKTQRCVGAEALVRWQHPNLGLIAPDAFIPITEQTGLIQELSEWVIQQVIQDQAELQEDAVRYISINLSPTLLGSEDLLDYVTQTLAIHSLPAQRILFEVTETRLVEPVYANRLSSFRQLGIRLALDDFGTGYSSLRYLDKFEFDYLKIDRCFIQRIQTAEGSPIMDTLIELGHTLGLEVIAEGVETVEQCDYLQQAGVRYVQGWLFAKAMPLADFSQFLQQQQSLPL
ncbi:MAG: EAL domain-containing protein [Oscillatoriophycideae cyanobacterium NC_groundwater_1537_Pr4_S-0.65um_50_18]|nr:EAL domain-containing protein [Oscillatoriophycideae cyanobacterium NC_groundwater_1537_Pr4_S-0.65um_50_18]